MAITLVQSNQVSPAGTTLTATVTLPSGVSLGNLLVVAFTEGSNNTTMTGPTGWTQAVINKPAGTNATIAASIWYLLVGAGQVGQTSWLFTGNASHSIYLSVEEWHASMGWQASPLDVTAMGNTIATPVASTTISSGTTATTAQAEELWVAVLAYKATAATESSITAGWTKDTEATLASNNTATMLYQVAAATGTAHCQYTIPSPFHWSGVTATFMPISVVTNTWNAVDTPLTVQDNDLTGDLDSALAVSVADSLSVLDSDALAGIDFALTARSTDNVSSVETNAKTQVQTSTDSLANVETGAFAKVQLATDALTVFDSDAIAGADSILAVSVTDSLTSVETNTKTQVQTSTDNLTVSEATGFVSIALIDQTAVTETGQEGLSATFLDSALLGSEVNATGLVSSTSDLLTHSEVDTLTAIVGATDSLSPTESMTALASTIILMPDVALTPTESVLAALVVQGTDTPTTTELDTLAVSVAFSESLILSESITSVGVAVTNLADVALAPADTLTLALFFAATDTLTISDVSTKTVAAVISDIGVSPLESVLTTRVTLGSDVLISTESGSFLTNAAFSDGVSSSDAFTGVLGSSSGDSLSVNEAVTVTLAAAFIESATVSEGASSTTIELLIDSVTSTDSTASSTAYVYVDVAAASDVLSVTLALSTLDQSTTSDTFASVGITGPSLMVSLEQNTVTESLTPTLIVFTLDQMAYVLDQSTTTGIMLEVDSATSVETLTVIETNAMNFVDASTVTELLLATVARTFELETVAAFEADTFVVILHPTETVSVTDTLTSNSALTMIGVDSTTTSDSAQSRVTWLLVDSATVGEGLAALPFALSALFTDSVASTDSVLGLVSAPLADSSLTLSDKAGATYTLLFADSLISTDVSRETLAVFAVDAPPAISDSLIPQSYNNSLMDSLVPSDTLSALVIAPLGPDTLYVIDALTAISPAYLLGVQRVRSGVAVMLVHTIVVPVRVRSGIVLMVVHTSAAPQVVRSGVFRETL